MADVDNVKEIFENIKENIEETFEYDLKMEQLRKEVLKKFDEYKNTMNYMAADAPIEILCLSPSVEKILSGQGFLRIYDLFNVDFVKIKGLGIVRIKELTSRLDQFFSML